MSGDQSPGKEPENSSAFPAAGIPMTSEIKNGKKKPGTEWLGILYGIVGIFVLIAAFQLYFTIQDLIRTWISDQFVPVVSAAYYIVVIVVGVWLLREYVRNQESFWSPPCRGDKDGHMRIIHSGM